MRNLQRLLVVTGILHVVSAEAHLVRLTEGDGVTTGRVEVSKNGTTWGTVCDDLWTDREAQVVCRQLSFQWGTAYSSAAFGEGNGDIYLDNVQCTGSENNLGECQHNGWGNNNCRHYEDAGVACYNSSVRLKSRGRTDVGTVEIRETDGWVEVCDRDWGSLEARVLCREMGFVDGIGQCCSTLNVDKLRLKSRGRTDVGTVEIRETDGWVEVCDRDWGSLEARVLCREMGFVDGVAQCCSTLGVDKSGSASTSTSGSDASASRSFTSFGCQGHEKTLLECKHQKQATKCSADHRASAICYKKPLKEVDMSFAVRLGNGSDSSRYWGEVNVRYKGVWGQVCAMGDNWNNNSAQIVCKQLGFVGGAAYGTVNETFMPSWIMNLNCTGKEKSLEHCTIGPWGRPVRTCKPAYALCYQKGISVKLVGGGSYYGRVEVTHDKHTGTICDKAWSTSDARVVCKYLGFADGDPVTGSYYGGGSGPIMMNGLGCYGYETNIVQCRNKGWMTYKGSKCDDHKNDASVVCYKNVRLSRGDHSHGVVQIMEESWSVLCGEGFSNKEAKVTCQQLGFQDGIALAMGSFGTFYGKYVRPNISCNGTEKSILDCSYDQFRACQKDSFLGYAVVSCFNGALSDEKQMKLEGGGVSSMGNQTGRVSVQQYGIWGRVCPNSWDDNDATVVCKMLNYTGGVAYKYTSSGYGPYTLGQVDCEGSENTLFDCKVSSGLCDAQFSSGDAGVLCYTNQKPALRLVGSANSGYLEIILDSFTGTICDFGWSRYDASVACKQLGFQDGEPRSHFPSNGATVVMSSMGCYGGESSIFMCRNPGWQKNIDERCFEPNRNAGVFCYNNVRISGGQNNENSTAGKVEMYYHSSWVTMCAKGFDDMDAKVVCRELGFPNSKALVPGAFGRRYYSEFVLGFNCTGTEPTITNCPYEEEGECPDRSSNYASVLCSKFPIDNANVLILSFSSFPATVIVEKHGMNGTIYVRILSFSSFPATVIVEKHGMNGTICADGWDNVDADVLCRQLNYSGGGVAFGPQYSGSSTPIWLTNVSCTGREKRIQDCKFQETPTSGCLSNHMAARVYCYEGPGFQVRLVGGSSPSEGRVEVSYGGEWGTICDSYWADNDARVVCRQLGFLDGVAQPNSFYGPGSGPSWLYYVRCDGTEKSIWSCTNSGFNVSHTSCRNHKYDASVYCTNRIRLEPNVTYGAVEIWTDNRYQLVCADGFDDIAATVVCKTQGFQHGISICCSAFGEMSYDIGYHGVKCYGDEASILNCTHTQGPPEGCASKKYASVACSKNPASGDYELRLFSHNRGPVSIRHFDIWGHICADDFDDAEAMVICRQLKFYGGFAYYQVKYSGHKNKGIPWLSNINCTGDESYLGKCGNIRWGSVETCNQKHSPAVYCYKKEGYKFRLANGTSPMSGRVEISIDDEWGTVCGTSKFDDEAAHVLCRELGHTSGRALDNGHFGEGKGKIMIPYIRCVGNESSLLRCGIKIEPKDAIYTDRGRLNFALRSTYYTCRTHRQDAAVQCYHQGYKFRLANGTNNRAGRVELSIDGKWGTICANGVDQPEAEVLCRQMNFTGGQTVRRGSFGLSSGPMYINYLNCHGNESSVWDCPVQFFNTGDYDMFSEYGPDVPYQRLTSYRRFNSCYSSRDSYAALQCYDQVRLSNTNDLNYGILEVYLNGTWGAVCDKGFHEVAARVACRQLGFQDGKFQPGSALGTHSEMNITIKDLKCNGGERDLNDCKYNLGTCPTGNYVTVYCNSSVIKTADKVCLRIKEGRYYGSLEANKYGFWGPICPQGWNDTSATAACRQLGYRDKVTLRIKEGRYYGSLEANKYGFWGPICPQGWNDTSATAACRQLGYLGGVAYNGTSRLDAPMALGSFRCSGSETEQLSDCDYKGFNQDVGCQYPIKGRYQRSTAGVLCYNHQEGVKFRMSESSKRGKVEIMFNGEWGRVCNSSWGDKEARVFCRQFDFIDGKAASFPGRGKGHVWMNYIDCHGSERSILECSNTWTPGSANCDDAGVTCFDDVRLTKGDDVSYGAVEVNFKGKWGVTCNLDWDKADADVTCRQIGYTSGLPLCCAPFGYIKSHGTMEAIQCRGDERRLTECKHTPPYGSVCSMDYAAAACFNGPRNDQATVSISGRDNATGAVILNYMNISGGICTDDWDDKDALVVCGQLGFSKGIAYRHYKWNTGRGKNAPFWTSNVKCTGAERRLDDCPKVPYGEVTTCVSRHYAGALCYQNEGVAYKLSGGERNFGRVEVSVNGVWGTLCNRYWDVNDARVLCRSRGYATGFPLYTGNFKTPPAKVYEANLHCNGSEENLLKCPHEGWEQQTPDEHCLDHSKDAAVYCYSSVKLGSGVGKHITHGPVLYYNKDGGNWEVVCDRGFNDRSATLVCKDLMFDYGVAISGSAYGKIYESIQENKTVSCEEGDRTIENCVRDGPCNGSDFYASVACFKDSDSHIQEGYEFEIAKGKAGDFTGVVTAKHYGLPGRICSTGWNDVAAMVLCRSLNYQRGIAFHQSDNDFSPLLTRGPYWMSDVVCQGNEPSLVNCSFSDRTQAKNCSGKTSAAVLCYNEDGIKYKITNDNATDEKADSPYGRVEIAVNNIWGTVCDAAWDNMDARVLCRQKGYHDGYALGEAHYGPGKVSPIWLSHLKCRGDEASLHKCPHKGFKSAIMSGSLGWWKCRSHKDDASVYCFNDLKLSGGFESELGAVLVYNNNQWHAVCDVDFDSRDARVACRTLGFMDGKMIPGSSFGNITLPIGVNAVKCDGDEKKFKTCKMTFGTECDTGMYASVYCSHKNIVDTGFHVRVKPDNVKLTSYFHGFLEVHIDGVWGSVCSDGWDDKAAGVACRSLGFSGGYAYRPPNNFTSPILMDKVACRGQESSLRYCSYATWNKAKGCDFYAQRAGIFCNNDTGLEFRLGGGEVDQGRAEIKYNGVWGGICDWLWDSRDAKVFCRNLNYKDGLEVVGARYGHVNGPLWFTRVSCVGDETSVLQCRHTGFNSSDEMEGVYAGLCRTRSHDAAARCFSRTLKITDLRLVNSEGDASYGRVEVYLAGPDQWGTVCDDYWGDADAKVVCRQLGYEEGRGVKGAHFGRGKGPVWLDNLRCVGNETHLRNCPHNSFAVQNCNHGEDAGVYCSGEYNPSRRLTTPKPTVKEGLTSEHIEESTTVVIAVTVSIIFVLVAVIVIGGYIVYRRTRPKGEIKKMLVQNDMNDPNPAPQAAQGTTDGRVTLSKLKAHFSKPKLIGGESSNGASSEGVSGVTNPVYDDRRNKGVIMEESIEQPRNTSYDI